MKQMYCIRLGHKLAVADLSYIGGSIWELSRINVPADYRGQGYGSELLGQVCDDADNEGVTLVLNINPYGALTYQQLQDWYERWGFVASELHGDSIFRREPEE